MQTIVNINKFSNSPASHEIGKNKELLTITNAKQK